MSSPIPLTADAAFLSRAEPAFAGVAWEVLVLKKDRIYGEALRHAVERASPGAIIRTVRSLEEARAALLEEKLKGVDLCGLWLP